MDHVFKTKHLCLLRQIQHNAGARTFKVLSTNEICFLCILKLSLFIRNEMRAHLLGTPGDMLSKAQKWASASTGALIWGTWRGDSFLRPSYLQEFQ